MSTLEEVKQMQTQGITEDQIINTLQTKGVSYKEISEALAQSKIKAAIEEPVSEPTSQAVPPVQQVPTNQPSMSTGPDPSFAQTLPTAQGAQTPELQAPGPEQMVQETPQPLPETMPGMQQSIMQNSELQAPSPTQEYMPMPESGGGYDQYGGGDPYQQYEYSGGAMSADTISEISEQIVAERITEIRKHLENVIDFKTSIETKADALDERLKRIEKIVDTLQASVLRKVGDYVNNVDDIKRELIETQKSFARLVPEIKKNVNRSKSNKSPRKSSKKKK